MIFVRKEIIITRNDPRFEELDVKLRNKDWTVEESNNTVKYTSQTHMDSIYLDKEEKL